MESLSREEVMVLSGRTDGREWWDQGLNCVDVDRFCVEFLSKFFTNDLILYNALLVKNVWPDLERVLDRYRTQEDAGGQTLMTMDRTQEDAGGAGQTMITMAKFTTALSTLIQQGVISAEDRDAMLAKIRSDDLCEKAGRFVGQLDYLNNFLMRYISQDMALHSTVYRNWEDCADKFQRFATMVEEPKLNYRQFRELCRQFVFDLRFCKRALPRHFSCSET